MPVCLVTRGEKNTLPDALLNHVAVLVGVFSQLSLAVKGPHRLKTCREIQHLASWQA